MAHCFIVYSFTSSSKSKGRTNLIESLPQIWFLTSSTTYFHYRNVMSRLFLTKNPSAFQKFGNVSSGARSWPFGLTSETLYVLSSHMFSPLSPHFLSLSFLFLDLSVVVSGTYVASLCGTSSFIILRNWDKTSYSCNKIHKKPCMCNSHCEIN